MPEYTESVITDCRRELMSAILRGHDGTEIAEKWYKLAYAELEVGEEYFRYAVQDFEEARRILATMFQEDHPWVASCNWHLMKGYRALGNLVLSEKFRNTVVAGFQHTLLDY